MSYVFIITIILIVVFSIISNFKKKPPLIETNNKEIIDYKTLPFYRNYANAAKKYNLVLGKPFMLDAHQKGISLYGALEKYSIKVFMCRMQYDPHEFGNLRFYDRYLNHYKATFHEDSGFYFLICPINSSLKTTIKTMSIYFDENIYIETENEPEVIGLLNCKARQIICDLKSCKIYITRHNIKMSASIHDDITEKLEMLTSLIGILKREGTAFEHLVENYIGDGNEDVRKRNFQLLIKHFPLHEGINTIIGQGLEDRNPFINFYAFKASKRDNDFHYLHELWNRSSELLKLKIEIIDYLAKNQSEAILDFLINHFYGEYLAVQIMIIRSCRMMGDKKQEQFLIDLLNLIEQLKGSDLEFHEELIAAAIQSLGAYGTQDAVEPLSTVKSLFFKQYTKNAIKQIQSRYTSEKGLLSLIKEEDLSGSLSLFPDDE